MNSQPTWEPVDSDTGDLLTLLADDGSAIPSKAEEWVTFMSALSLTAATDPTQRRVINPNRLRRRVRGQITPQRIGAFTRRAVLEGLVEYTGEWRISDDTEGKNTGKPCRELRWLG